MAVLEAVLVISVAVAVLAVELLKVAVEEVHLGHMQLAQVLFILLVLTQDTDM
jgi:hypothetical protein